MKQADPIEKIGLITLAFCGLSLVALAIVVVGQMLSIKLMLEIGVGALVLGIFGALATFLTFCVAVVIE